MRDCLKYSYLIFEFPEEDIIDEPTTAEIATKVITENTTPNVPTKSDVPVKPTEEAKKATTAVADAMPDISAQPKVPVDVPAQPKVPTQTDVIVKTIAERYKKLKADLDVSLITFGPDKDGKTIEASKAQILAIATQLKIEF